MAASASVMLGRLLNDRSDPWCLVMRNLLQNCWLGVKDILFFTVSGSVSEGFWRVKLGAQFYCRSYGRELWKEIGGSVTAWF
ncbi:unnamed protein product [Lathyrus oleraceus]